MRKHFSLQNAAQHNRLPRACTDTSASQNQNTVSRSLFSFTVITASPSPLHTHTPCTNTHFYFCIIRIILLPVPECHQQDMRKWECPNWTTANRIGNKTRASTVPYHRICNLNPSRMNTRWVSLLFLHLLALILTWWHEKSVFKMAAKMLCHL